VFDSSRPSSCRSVDGEEHLHTLVFLDLNISIDPKRKIVYSAYQKEMILYLHIPPGSAYPKNMIRGLVFGRLRAYWLQNTRLIYFYHMASLLAKRLIARGYTLQQLLQLFKEAEVRLTALRRAKMRNPVTAGSVDTTLEPKPLFFYLQFHPRGIQRQQIRAAYNERLAPLLSENRRLIVAVSHPRNLRDQVCTTRLPNLTDNNPSDFIICGDNPHSPQKLSAHSAFASALWQYSDLTTFFSNPYNLLESTPGRLTPRCGTRGS
jgi:hypothetical protein